MAVRGRHASEGPKKGPSFFASFNLWIKTARRRKASLRLQSGFNWEDLSRMRSKTVCRLAV